MTTLLQFGVLYAMYRNQADFITAESLFNVLVNFASTGQVTRTSTQANSGAFLCTGFL